MIINRVQHHLFICVVSFLLLSSCSQNLFNVTPTKVVKKEISEQYEDKEGTEEKPTPTLSPSETLKNSDEELPADIGFSNSPYPTNDFGETLFLDNFDQPATYWQYEKSIEIEQENDKTFGVFQSENDSINHIIFKFDHQRNVIYKAVFKLNSGFCDFIFIDNENAGNKFYITSFNNNGNIHLRFNIQEEVMKKGYQLGEITVHSDDGWVDLELRRFDRYVDVFANGIHTFSYKLPDEMLTKNGLFKFSIYDPFDSGAELEMDKFEVFEAKPENVFLDTIYLAQDVNETGSVKFDDLIISRVEKQIPDRVNVKDGWHVDYFIAPSDVRSPNDLEITDKDEIVVLQQRNWGLIKVGSNIEPEWYLNTKKSLGELVTNGILDRDRSGNLLLINSGWVYQINDIGKVTALFQLNGHSANVTQSPIDNALYYIEDNMIKRWVDGNVEIVEDSFGGYGQLVFTDDGIPYYFPWGSSDIYKLIPDTFEIKQLIFSGSQTLPNVHSTYFNRINTLGNTLVMTLNSEVIRVDPQTGKVTLLASGFNQLEGITTGSDMQVCFVSRFDSGVYCWDDGNIEIVSMPTFLMTPMGIAVNSAGEVFSGNDEATHVFKYDSEGNYLRAFDVNPCQSPMVDLTVDDKDNVYVSAGEYFTGTSELVKINTQDEIEILAAYPDIQYPSGIDWYDGNVYVIGVGNGTLYRLENDGSLKVIQNSIPTSITDSSIPMRIDNNGNFYIFITANKEMQLYHVSPEGKWKALPVGVDQRSITVLEYWPERHALLIGTTDFWNENGQLLVYYLEKGTTIQLLSGAFAVDGIALTPDGGILVSDDWDNCIYELTLEK